MDVENMLAKAAENLSVRRAFGTAYEKDGMLRQPGNRRELRLHGHWLFEIQLASSTA